MLDFSDIELAARRIAGAAHRTPVLTSRTLDEHLGSTVLMKAENLQRMGAFKFRGGFNAIASLDATPQRARGVVAFSSGNHALRLPDQVLVDPARLLSALAIAATEAGGADRRARARRRHPGPAERRERRRDRPERVRGASCGARDRHARSSTAACTR